ncbi:MAG: sigma-70 family RNA polymerase sigma factor [Dehalococcoidia bacterium]|nr:sigma-70 family RNA polymerase sigma factor [Dehalococcoidia bacterium]
MVELEDVLVERAKVDPQAFGVLYERHVTRVYSYMYNRTGSAPDAEDLTEKVFFQALTHMQSYEGRGIPFSVWLFRIAHNLVVNWHRDNSRRRTIRLDDVDPVGEDSPDVERQEDQAAVRKMLAKLPSDRQNLLVLKYVNELSNAQIGQVMGRTEGAIKALLHRTLIALRKELNIKENGY